MANKKISELPYINVSEISGNTLVPLVTYFSAATGDTVHTYTSDLQNYIGGNYLPLSGGTVSGATGFLDSSGTIVSIDSNSRLLYDSTNSGSIDWENRNLSDLSGSKSVDYANHQLNDSTAVTSADWEQRLMYDAGPNLVIDWQNLILYDGGTNVVLDWQNKTLIGMTIVQVDNLVVDTPYVPTGSTDPTGPIGTISWSGDSLYVKNSTEWVKFTGLTSW